MKTIISRILALVAIAGLWLIDLAPESQLIPTFVGEAYAIIGRPATPVSYAGVARRTTRRVVYASAASADAAASANAAATQTATQSAPPPAPAVGPLPSGTVVSALPSGCVSAVQDDQDYFNCAGVYYKPTFQSGNLVYVVK
jgi:hypothetical protein